MTKLTWRSYVWHYFSAVFCPWKPSEWRIGWGGSTPGYGPPRCEHCAAPWGRCEHTGGPFLPSGTKDRRAL
jgi:hypothetical protein